MFKSARALALRDVDEIVQNQFAIVPRINADNQSMSKTDAARVFSDDADAARGFGELLVLWNGNPIDYEHSNARAILHTCEPRVSNVSWAQWITV